MTILRRGITSGTAMLLAGMLIHASMLVSLRFGYLNPLFDDAMHRSGQGVDFFSVVQSGRNLTDGISIYSLEPAQQIVPYYNPYRYHPFVALTIGILSTTVPPDVAYILWVLILEVLLVINLFLTKSLFSDQRSAAIAMSLWLLFSPYYLELYMGQFSFLMASLVFWTLIAWTKKQTRNGDLFWTFSLMTKSNSALFAPVLLKMGRGKAVIIWGAVAAGAALPYFLFMPGSAESFLHNVSRGLTAPTLFGNQGFAALIGILVIRSSGLWTDFAQEFAPRVDHMNDLLFLPIGIWTLLVIGLAVVVTVKAPRDSITGLFLLWLLSYFLFYKHVWEHQYVMLMPVFVLLYQQMTLGLLRIPTKLFWTSFAVIALPTVFFFIDVAPVLFDPELPWKTWESLLFHAPKPLAVLMLFSALAVELWQKARSVRSPLTGIS